MLLERLNKKEMLDELWLSQRSPGAQGWSIELHDCKPGEPSVAYAFVDGKESWNRTIIDRKVFLSSKIHWNNGGISQEVLRSGSRVPEPIFWNNDTLIYDLNIDLWVVRLFWWQRMLQRSKQRMITWNISVHYVDFPDEPRALWGKVEGRPLGIHDEFVLSYPLERLAWGTISTTTNTIAKNLPKLVGNYDLRLAQGDYNYAEFAVDSRIAELQSSGTIMTWEIWGSIEPPNNFHKQIVDWACIMLDGSFDFEFTPDWDLLNPMWHEGRRSRTLEVAHGLFDVETFVDNQHLADLINAQNPNAAIGEIWTIQNLELPLTGFLNGFKWSMQVQDNSGPDRFGREMTLQLFIGKGPDYKMEPVSFEKFSFKSEFSMPMMISYTNFVVITELARGWIATDGEVTGEILMEVIENSEFMPLLSNAILHKAVKRLQDKEEERWNIYYVGIPWTFTDPETPYPHFLYSKSETSRARTSDYAELLGIATKYPFLDDLSNGTRFICELSVGAEQLGDDCEALKSSKRPQ